METKIKLVIAALAVFLVILVVLVVAITGVVALILFFPQQGSGPAGVLGGSGAATAAVAGGSAADNAGSGTALGAEEGTQEPAEESGGGTGGAGGETESTPATEAKNAELEITEFTFWCVEGQMKLRGITIKNTGSGEFGFSGKVGISSKTGSVEDSLENIGVEWKIKSGNDEFLNLALKARMLSLGSGTQTANVILSIPGYEGITFSQSTAGANC